jgi:hypothetical protein
VVGLQPWLPWPLAASRWWTEPVRAEYLAVLRIGLALVLLWDVVFVYWPLRHDFFGPDSLGSPELFAHLARNRNWNWSILRGFSDPLLSTLALVTWLASTAYLTLGLRARLRTTTPDPPSLRWVLAAWLVSGVAFVLGVWARVPVPVPDTDPRTAFIWKSVVLAVPLVVFGVAVLFFGLGLWRRYQGGAEDRWAWRGVLACVAGAAVLAAVGWLKWQTWADDPAGPAWLGWTRTQWLAEPRAIDVGMAAWVAATVCLLLGLGTRVSAVAVWVLGTSFDNLNSYVNNAGDQVRAILTFYLMLCPCGAAWSLDRWLARRRGGDPGPRYVWPWPLRLLFVQLVFMYFLNGLYKVGGKDWAAGTSLYYVLNDVVLARFSYAQFPVPLGVIYWLSLAVLAWELSFPLLVLFRWTRVAALLFGVAFHLGIALTMEIGGFVPYMLVLYLPLLPWDRWLRPRAPAIPRAPPGG